VRELGFCVRWSYKLDEFFCRAVAVYIIAESGDMSTKYHNLWENWTTGCGIFMTSMAAVVTCTKNSIFGDNTVILFVRKAQNCLREKK